MKYVVEQDFRSGIPQTWLAGGLKPRGLAGHWTAGAPGRRGALGTIRFFIDRADRNASYHEIWWFEAPDTFGVIEIVRADRASHSMNPNQPPNGPWEPNARVRRILGDKWWNPNSFSYSMSFAGMPEDLAAAMKYPAFIAGAQRRTRELMARFAGSLANDPLFNHGEGQPSTRRDWGTALRPAILGAMLPDTSYEGVDALNFVKYDPGTVRFDAGAAIRLRPGGVAAGEKPWITIGPTGYLCRTFIGWVRGEEYDGSDLWGCYAVTSTDPDRLAFTHKVNVIGDVQPLALPASDSISLAEKEAEIAELKSRVSRLRNRLSEVKEKVASVAADIADD